MDFDPDRRQLDLLDRLRTVVASNPAQPPTIADACDPALDRALADLAAGELTLLDRVLLVEETARLGAAVDPTATILVGPPLAGAPDGPLALRAADAPPLRFAAHAIAVVDVRPPAPTIATVVPGSFAAVPSGMSASFGTVETTAAERVGWSAPIEPIDAFRLGRTADIAGAARSALELTAAYLDQRKQFGRSLSSFQALRHRLSEIAVDVEATSALVRIAGFEATEAAILGAASYAVDTAARLVPELHQMSGARGFTYESGLPARTMRITAARVELGIGVSPISVAEATWTS